MKIIWILIVLQRLASQQSIKAYVDAQITAQDLDFAADSGGCIKY